MKLARLIRGELGRALRTPAWWVLLAAHSLLSGLFLVARVAAGDGGDAAGVLREAAAALLPLATVAGAAQGGAGPRHEGRMALPLGALAQALVGVFPALVWVAMASFLSAAAPLWLAGNLPVDGGRLGAAFLGLLAIGLPAALLGAAGASLVGHAGGGGLLGFGAALALFGAGGLARATGLAGLAAFDLSAPLAPAAAGWVAVAPLAPGLAIGVLAWGAAALGLEVDRW